MIRRRLGLLASGAALAALLTATPAAATQVQIDPSANKVVCASGCASPTAFAQTGSATLAASTTSFRVALPTTDATVVVYNPGTTNAHLKLGSGTVIAATTDLVLPGGGIIVISNAAGNLDLAAIMESGSATLQLWTGTGSAQFALAGSGGGGGGGGAVTNAGTFAVQNTAAGVASENHLGNVTGQMTFVPTTPTTTAATRASGDVIGGLLTFSAAGRVAGGTGLVQSAVVDWKSTQSAVNAAMDIFLFSDTTLSSTCTNASAFVLSASDWAKVVGVIHLTDTTVGNTTTHVQATGLALPYSTAATTLYGCAITRGAPVVGSTSDITVKLGLIEN